MPPPAPADEWLGTWHPAAALSRHTHPPLSHILAARPLLHLALCSCFPLDHPLQVSPCPARITDIHTYILIIRLESYPPRSCSLERYIRTGQSEGAIRYRPSHRWHCRQVYEYIHDDSCQLLTHIPITPKHTLALAVAYLSFARSASAAPSTTLLGARARERETRNKGRKTK